MIQQNPCSTAYQDTLKRELRTWLHEEDPVRLEELWASADAVRRRHVGDAVHLRGLIEVSSHCARTCAYCGLRAPHREIQRYRLTSAEIIQCAQKAAELGYGTVVMQAGEDPALTRDWVGDVVRRIKRATGLAVTLSLGERDEADLAAWREAGADRYLLRFETSDRELFDRIHPPAASGRIDRIATLRTLKRLGYEAGSGVMIGIPGQSVESLVDDLMLFLDLDLDMIGMGPFLAHPATPLGAAASPQSIHQAPATELMVYKMIALARIVCPGANIPSTTALATINRANGRELGLARGANVVMPNLTPMKYRAMYEIYPAKACIHETAEQCHGCLLNRIRSLGRTIGTGPGGRGAITDA